MGELGELLRKTREAKGLSLAQVEEVTRIHSAYLQALEEEAYDRLPPLVYVKGFLKNYALYLDLDPQQVFALYHEPESEPASRASVMLDEPLGPPTLERYWPLLASGLLVLILLAAIGGWAYHRYYGLMPFVRATATPTSTFTPTLPMPTPTRPPPTVTPLPTRTTSPTSTPTTPVGLELRIEVVGQRAWLLVQADGQRVFAGILEPGAVNAWTARERIVLRSGNAGAVRVTVNGQVLGPLGELGQVVEKEWTMPGVPTRTPAPTATP